MTKKRAGIENCGEVGGPFGVRLFIFDVSADQPAGTVKNS